MKREWPSIEILMLPVIAAFTLYVFVVIPIQEHHYKKRHPEFFGWPDTTLSGCDKHRNEYGPGNRLMLVNDNPCFFSPYGTVVQIRKTELPFTEPGMNVLKISRGGPVYALWKSQSKALIACVRCRESDVTEIRTAAEGVQFEFRFETPDLPLPENQIEH